MILKKLYNTLETKLTALFPGAHITMQGNVEGQADNRFEIGFSPFASNHDAELIHHQLIVDLKYIDSTKNHLQKIEVFEGVVEGFVNGLKIEGESYHPNQFSLDTKAGVPVIQFSLKVCYKRQSVVETPTMANLILKEG